MDRQLVPALFLELDSQKKPGWFPSAGMLADELRKKLPKEASSFRFPSSESILFATAAVEMWLRAVHSFLISNSLEKASPIWSSISGYYASHYVMRAFAHLHGHFLLRKRKIHVKISHGKGKSFVCDVVKESNNEHTFYWKLVNSAPMFAQDCLFSDNNDPLLPTDSSHRGYANYWDHVNNFHDFITLSEDYLIERIKRVSDLVTYSPTFPDHRKYPDLDSVHIVAYARIVRFRSYLDNLIGTRNKYWRYYRDPSWFTKYLDFQTMEPSPTATLATVQVKQN